MILESKEVDEALSRAIQQPGFGICVLGSERTQTVVTSHDFDCLSSFFHKHPEFASNVLLFHQCRFEDQTLLKLRLFEDLISEENTCLSDLRILSCPIKSEGVANVLQNLNPLFMRRLSMINVNATGKIAGEAIRHFLSGNVCNNQLILEFNSNSLKREGAELIGQGLRSLSFSLKRLDLSTCSLGDDGGAQLLNSLSDGKRVHLSELILDENDLGLETLGALSKCLSCPSNLKELSLNDNPNLLTPPSTPRSGMKQIASGLKRSIEQNGCLERLFLRRSGITDLALLDQSGIGRESCLLQFLLEGLEANKSLRLLDVQKNKMPYDSLALLLFQRMPKVLHLAEFFVSIYGSSWDRVLKDFERAFFGNFSLTNVQLELLDLEDGGEVHAYNESESHYQLHERLARWRKRNTVFRKAGQFCQSQIHEVCQSFWPYGLTRFAMNEYSLDSLYFSVCRFFSN